MTSRPLVSLALVSLASFYFNSACNKSDPAPEAAVTSSVQKQNPPALTKDQFGALVAKVNQIPGWKVAESAFSPKGTVLVLAEFHSRYTESNRLLESVVPQIFSFGVVGLENFVGAPYSKENLLSHARCTEILTGVYPANIFFPPSDQSRIGFFSNSNYQTVGLEQGGEHYNNLRSAASVFDLVYKMKNYARRSDRQEVRLSMAERPDNPSAESTRMFERLTAHLGKIYVDFPILATEAGSTSDGHQFKTAKLAALERFYIEIDQWFSRYADKDRNVYAAQAMAQALGVSGNGVMLMGKSHTESSGYSEPVQKLLAQYGFGYVVLKMSRK